MQHTENSKKNVNYSKVLGNKSRYWNTSLRVELKDFIEQSFSTLCPTTMYQHNWHIDACAAALDEVAKGNIKRLIINMPPRCLKSIMVSVIWPAWLLGNDPSRRIMCASYSQALSTKHSLDCRLLVRSKWFRKKFKYFALDPDQQLQHKFLTTQRGFRFATSVEGTVTGEGGDILIVDDPHNAANISSAANRRQVTEWFTKSFLTRLNHREKGAVVVVMQRLHAEDLTGYLLEHQAGDWTVLSLPAEFDHPQTWQFGEYRHTQASGSLLDPVRLNAQVLEQLKRELGTQAYNAQYLQQPISVQGTFIKPFWLRYYETIPFDEEGFTLQSWDTAIKTEAGHDYSVCTTWQVAQGSFYLVDVLKERLDYPMLKRSIVQQAERYQPLRIVVEDKASGSSILQDLQREALPLQAASSKQSKALRLARVTPLWEAGKIFLPRRASWLADYEHELLTFPFANHDDQVDSTSQALAALSLLLSQPGFLIRRS